MKAKDGLGLDGGSKDRGGQTETDGRGGATSELALSSSSSSRDSARRSFGRVASHVTYTT